VRLFHPSKTGLIAGKLFRANVAIVDSRLTDHRLETLHHLRWPSHIIDRGDGVFQMPGEHFLINQSNLTLPGPLRFRHFSHAGDQLVVRILSFQSLELIEKGSILWTAVRVEKKDAVRQVLLRCTEHNASEGRDSDTAR